MAVPEAAVHENDGAIARQRQVRLAWQLPVMEAIAKAQQVEPASNNHFGLCVRCPDTSHHPAAGGGINNVSQARRSVLVLPPG
jgi:hypothetical protein